MPRQTANKPMRQKIMNNSNLKQKQMKQKGHKNIKKKHIPNSGVKTGTLPRKKKEYLTENEKLVIELSQKTGKNPTKIKRIELELGMTTELSIIKGRIDYNMNDNVVLDMNASNLRKKRKGVKALALALNRLDIPDDISGIILHYARDNITIEKNIYKIMPKDLINAFYKQAIEGLEEEEIDTIMAIYKGTESIYEFLFRAFGFRRTRRNLSRYYDTLFDGLSRTYYDCSRIWVGNTTTQNQNNIYNTINYIENFMHMNNL